MLKVKKLAPSLVTFCFATLWLVLCGGQGFKSSLLPPHFSICVPFVLAAPQRHHKAPATAKRM